MSMRVWAPAAERVELIEGDERPSMRPEAGGWWSTDRTVPAGQPYAFSLDGGPPRPDPRGERLADGVHGPSSRVDHAAFDWHDEGWQPPDLLDGIVYELHLGTFSAEGTFDGAIAHLDDLADLGVTHVELMPVHAFPGRRGWGYDVAGLFAVHEPYGGPDGLKRFVDAAHTRGLGVVLDVVYNHLGPDGAYVAEFGPYLTDRFRTPWGGAINLGDPGADEVRRFIIDNACGWLRDYHVDALRLDAVHAFVDPSAIHILEELQLAVEALAQRLGRRLTLVAESDLNDPRLLLPRSAGGYELPAQWSDDYHHALHTTLTGEHDGYYEDFTGFEGLVRVLERGWAYEARYSRHRGRRHGRAADGLALRRFLGYAQNHDQVGNRAQGDRLAALVDGDALRIAAALTICGPFSPLLFAGEEWGTRRPFLYFTDFDDDELGDAVRQGRRGEFGAFGWRPEDVPDPQAASTFEASRLDRSELVDEAHADLLSWHRRLIGIRRGSGPCPDEGRPEIRADHHERWLSMRWCGRSIALNLGDAERVVPLPPGLAILAASTDLIALVEGGVRLPPGSVAVLAEQRDLAPC